MTLLFLMLQIEECKSSRDFCIKMSLKYRWRQQWWSATNAAMQLGFACFHFYHFNYGWGIFQSLLAMVLAIYWWWSMGTNIKYWREWRAKWGQLIFRSETILAKYRGYQDV